MLLMASSFVTLASTSMLAMACPSLPLGPRVHLIRWTVNVSPFSVHGCDPVLFPKLRHKIFLLVKSPPDGGRNVACPFSNYNLTSLNHSHQVLWSGVKEKEAATVCSGVIFESAPPTHVPLRTRDYCPLPNSNCSSSMMWCCGWNDPTRYSL